MADKLDGLSKNLKQSSTWYRIFSMLVLSLLVFAVVVPLIIVLAISQAALSLVSGRNNNNLRYFGMEMTEYVNQVLRYITYNSEKKPYPFTSQSEKANLGLNTKTSKPYSEVLFKRNKSKIKKKLYEIETSAIAGEQESADQAPARNRYS